MTAARMNKVGLCSGKPGTKSNGCVPSTRSPRMGEELGIDNGQKELEMALRQKGKVSRRTFRNDPEEFAAVSKWLAKHKVTDLHVCIEATGTLWEAIALSLHEAGHKVSVVNPARLSAYAKSLL